MKTFYSKILIATLILFTRNSGQAQNCWAPLGSNFGNTTNGVNALIQFNGNLIAAGEFDSMGGIKAQDIASWDGSSWSSLSSATSTLYGGGRIFSLAIYDGDLFAGGIFDTIGGVVAKNIAKWNGTSWSPLGSGISGAYPSYVQVSSIVVYNGDLYVAGEFDSAGGMPTASIAKWDGNNWSSVANGITNSSISLQEYVLSLTVSNGVLYAGGQFKHANGILVNNIAAWDGTSWSPLGNGFDSSAVAAVVSYQGDIYAAPGYINYSCGPCSLYYITKWNGSSWSNVVSGPGTGTSYYGSVYSLFPFNGNLLAAGNFNVNNNNDTLNTGIAELSGGNWSRFVSLAGDTGVYLCMGIYNGHLYVGGGFTHIGSITAQSVAEYTCATDGINEIAKNKISIYPNPNNGVFNLLIDNACSGSHIGIYDLMGAQVYQSEISSSRSEINLTNQAPGTYLYKISDGKGANVASGSFIIE